MFTFGGKVAHLATLAAGKASDPVLRQGDTHKYTHTNADARTQAQRTQGEKEKEDNQSIGLWT